MDGLREEFEFVSELLRAESAKVRGCGDEVRIRLTYRRIAAAASQQPVPALSGRPNSLPPASAYSHRGLMLYFPEVEAMSLANKLLCAILQATFLTRVDGMVSIWEV